MTKEGIKGGGGDLVLGSSFGVPLVCRSIPSGAGTPAPSGRVRNPDWCSLEIGARRRVQLAVLGRAIPPGCTHACQGRFPSRSTLTPATSFILTAQRGTPSSASKLPRWGATQLRRTRGTTSIPTAPSTPFRLDERGILSGSWINAQKTVLNLGFQPSPQLSRP